MSIQAYSGEYLISPIPMEMSMNYCSHKCAVCFANLNQPNRKLDFKDFVSALKTSEKGKTLRSYLLKNKYPVLLSNRVDPFALSNYKQLNAIVEMLDEREIPIAWQTRGGYGIDEILGRGKVEHWYISISQYNDELRRKLEPGAPTITSRYELIVKLLERGQKISVGINPLVEEWMPEWEFEALCENLKEVGVKNVWIENIHLNKKQISNMTEKERCNVGSNILNSSTKRNKVTPSYFIYAHNHLTLNGFNVFTMNQPFRSSYFDEEHSVYKGKTLKTNQDFINHCFDNYSEPIEINFDQYYEFMKMDYYEKSFSDVDGFAYRIARNIYKKTLTKPFKVLKDVMFWYWDNLGISKSLHNNILFPILCYEERGKQIPYLSKSNKSYILYFDKNQHTGGVFISN